MKKWTVMLIPQDESGTSTLRLSELHFWLVSAVILALAFLTAFFFQRHQEVARQTEMLHQINIKLEQEYAKQAQTPVVVQTARSDVDKDEIRQVETRLRSEYETTIQAITSELSALYEMESRARSITGLSPRTPSAFESTVVAGNGKGGGPSHTGPFPYVNESEVQRPPYVIYGMARPSADMIIEEIRLRQRSLGELVKDMTVQQERIERVPAGWPLPRGKGRISSQFGYRRDPFSRRVRHHDGLDISAQKGTPAHATARGKVIKAEYISEYGNMVVVSHGDDLETAYAHLSAIHVTRGETVSRGDVVGLVGSTGKSTGNHLHYEVYLNGRVVNPAKYLSD